MKLKELIKGSAINTKGFICEGGIYLANGVRVVAFYSRDQYHYFSLTDEGVLSSHWHTENGGGTKGSYQNMPYTPIPEGWTYEGRLNDIKLDMNSEVGR